MARRKKFLIWASVLSGIMCAMYAFMVYALINNVNGFAFQLKELINEMVTLTETELNDYLNAFGEDAIFFAILNGVTCIVCAGFCFVKDELFYKLKYILIALGVINVLMGANFIASVLALFACFKREENTQTAILEPETMATQNLTEDHIREHLKLRNMADKIALIKGLKAEGGISDEEYAKLLDEIISTGSRE